MKSWIGTAALLALTTSCQAPETIEHGTDVHPREAWDAPNAPQIFGGLQSLRYEELAQEELRWGTLEQRPWSDDYWPWIRAGLAKRWLLPNQGIQIDVNAPDYDREVQRKIAAFIDQAREADEATRQRLSPMEKYDLISAGDFLLTRKELLHYASHLKYFEDNDIPWEWMGSCDGWALAALQDPAPRHPVLASRAGHAPVLFTVGDIRGLLSKAYTDNHKSRQAHFIGTRCNRPPDELAYDGNTRIVDGTLGRWTDTTLSESRNIQIIYNNWRLAGHQELAAPSNLLVFRYEDDPDQIYWLRAVAWTDRAREIVRVEVRPAPGGTLDPTVAAELRDFRYLKSCRDLNAGAFHVVLARLLSHAAAQNGGARGFVIEITRTDEVWNQPVYGYVTRLGTPLDLQAIDPSGPQDPYGPYRAPGTRSLVHAYTTVYFGVGNGPLVFYDERDERLSQVTYQYTLELDENGYVIGGEWHPSVRQTADRLTPRSGRDLLRFLGAQTARGEGSNAPDFLWRFPEGTRVLETCNAPPCLSAEIVYRLADCSRETPQPGDTVDIQGRRLPFVHCAL